MPAGWLSGSYEDCEAAFLLVEVYRSLNSQGYSFMLARRYFSELTVHVHDSVEHGVSVYEKLHL